MSETAPKRFYDTVDLHDEDGFLAVRLDGRMAKTVGRHALGARRETLARAIADEWAAQEERIDLSTMPLTRLQGFALDGGEAARPEWRETVLSYLASDLLCYRAPDPALAKKQTDAWQPPLERVGERLNGRFSVTEGVIAVAQPMHLIEAAGHALDELSPGRLFATKLLTEITGSAVLALDLVLLDADPDEAFAASRLDEAHQAEQWGVDEEAAARAARLRRDFDDVRRYLSLGPDDSAE